MSLGFGHSFDDALLYELVLLLLVKKNEPFSCVLASIHLIDRIWALVQYFIPTHKNSIFLHLILTFYLRLLHFIFLWNFLRQEIKVTALYSVECFHL